MVEPQEPEKLGASVSHTEATRPEIPINDEQASATHVKGDPLEIEFLLMSGKRKRWTVGTQETVEQVRTRIFQDWPRGLSRLSLDHRLLRPFRTRLTCIEALQIGERVRLRCHRQIH